MIFKLNANKNRPEPIYFVEGIKGFHYELSLQKLNKEFSSNNDIKYDMNDYKAVLKPIAMKKQKEALADFTFDYIKEKASKPESVFTSKQNKLKQLYALVTKGTVKSNTVGELTYYYTYFLKVNSELHILKSNLNASNPRVLDGYINTFYVKQEDVEGFLTIVDNWSEKQKQKQANYGNKIINQLRIENKIETKEERKQQKVDEELFP